MKLHVAAGTAALLTVLFQILGAPQLIFLSGIVSGWLSTRLRNGIIAGALGCALPSLLLTVAYLVTDFTALVSAFSVIPILYVLGLVIILIQGVGGALFGLALRKILRRSGFPQPTG